MSDQENQPVFTKTIAEAAKAIGVHERTLKTWLTVGAPEKTKNGYDVEAIREWRELSMKSGDGGFETPEDLKLRMQMAKLKEQEGKADKVTAESVIAAFKEEMMRQGLVQMEKVNNHYAKALIAFRKRMQRFPAHLAARYDPSMRRQLENDCAQHVEIILRALHADLENISEIINDD